MSNDGAIARRGLIGGAIGLGLLASAGHAAATGVSPYGLIGRMRAVPGQRDALMAILKAGTAAMPGCIAYLVNPDPVDADAIWITEVWRDKASHDASLALPAVREAIRQGRPLIAGFDLSLEAAPKP